MNEPEDSARFLLCKAANLGYSYSDFRMKQESPLSVDAIESFLQYCDRRARGEPVQYILGDWDFYDMTVKCRTPVLIPRPETEELVDYILKSKSLQSVMKELNVGDPSSVRGTHKFHILDVGAGTGVIGLALTKNIPQAECVALDINEAAVALATENARIVLNDANNSERYKCLHTSFMDYVQSHSSTSSKSTNKNMSLKMKGESPTAHLFDLIVSNPPYIPSADVMELQTEVRDWEDARALDGGPDGLDMIKDLVRHAPALMSPRGTRELWLEVSHLHPETIREWVRSEKIPLECFEAWNDLSGKPRFVRLRFIIE